MTKVSTRIEWIDIFKGIAIFLVVVGHLNVGDTLHNFIYGFHLPAFLFISGIFYKQRENIKDFFKRDIKKILIMFVFFAVLWLCFEYVYKLAINFTQGGAEVYSIGEYLWRSVVGLVLGNCNITNVSFGANWYLAMLVCIKTLYAFADRIVKKYNKIILSVLICIALVVGLVLLNGKNKLPFYLSSSLVGMAFFHIGRECSGLTTKVSTVSFMKSAFISVGSFVVSGIVSVIFGESNLGANTYENPVAFVVTAIFGTVGVCFLSVCISKIPHLKKVISYYGENSLSVMGWHSEIRIGILFLLSLIGLENSVIKLAVVIIATLILCVPLNKFTNLLIKGIDSVRFKYRKNI